MIARILFIITFLMIGNFSFGQQGSPPADSEIWFVEQMPEYPDGESALKKFINDNLVYPAEARKNGIKGRVIVQFVVTKNGKIEMITVTRGIGGGCDEEAVRLISIMPNWKPGRNNNLPVPCRFTLPIVFKL